VDVAEFMSRYSDVDFGHAWRFVRAFRSAPQLKPNVAAWISAAIFAKVTSGKVSDPGADKLSVLKDLLGSLREVECAILELENEREKQKERPLNPLPSSPAVISVRLWREEPNEGGS